MSSRLLIVEDEETLSASVSRVLTKAGYLVDTVPSSETALALLKNATYDLIISDVVLPGMSGIDLLKHFRRSRPDQKAIIMTAHISPDIAAAAARAGACHFILKPLMHDELVAAIQFALSPAVVPARG